jgi:hypothetical protein
MGTSGSYSGSGGKVGDRLRKNVSDWIDSLPSPAPSQGDNGDQAPIEQNRPRLSPEAILPIIALIRPRSPAGGRIDGPGGGASGTNGAATGHEGRGTGGPHRTVATSAGTAGRAASAAYAYRAGDTSTLERLGLNFAELTALGDQYEIARRIAYAACAQADSTIEDHEQRLVAAEVAEWVLSQEGNPPTPEEIARHSIGLIIADAFLTENGEIINNSDYADIAETDVRDAAEALAARADLSVDGVTEDQFTQAIERGIETLRDIYGDGS